MCASLFTTHPMTELGSFPPFSFFLPTSFMIFHFGTNEAKYTELKLHS